jgi:hypothetical protein
MNKRIKELRHQSTLVETYTSNDGTIAEGRMVDIEKFAELMVTEFITLADEFELDVNRSGLVDKIKHHFGVE